MEGAPGKKQEPKAQTKTGQSLRLLACSPHPLVQTSLLSCQCREQGNTAYIFSQLRDPFHRQRLMTKKTQIFGEGLALSPLCPSFTFEMGSLYPTPSFSTFPCLRVQPSQHFTRGTLSQSLSCSLFCVVALNGK